VDESRPDPGEQALSIASPPILSAKDLHLRSPAGLESSPFMPHLEPYWKDDFVSQAFDSLTDDPSRPLQSCTSDELDGSKSPPRLRRKLAPVAESESSVVFAICLDRSFSDDVQVNILLSSSKDEGHPNLSMIESEVGTRSSEVKNMQVAQAVVCEVMGSLQSAPTVDAVVGDTMSTVKIISKPGPTGGQNTTLQASYDRPDRPLVAPTGSVDVPAQPEEPN